MCFSASVSYGTAVVLITTGGFAIQRARQLSIHYWTFALTPILFGIQQVFEGRVWQLLNRGDTADISFFALGFHFFSHFLWLWWIPLSSYLIEPSVKRKNLFLLAMLLGLFAGSLVYFTLLLYPQWMNVSIEKHHIVYDIFVPYRGVFSIGISPSAVYALIILIPLIFSSHTHVRFFGWLIVMSIIITSLAYAYAFVSVWCFFAAIISIYIVYMMQEFSRRLS